MEISTRGLYDKRFTYAANGKHSESVPRDKWIQKIMCRLTMNYDTAGGASVAQDGILNIVKLLRLVADGNDTRRSLALKRLFYMNCLDYSTKLELVDVTAAAAAGKSASVSFEIPFMHDCKEDMDMSSLLPAVEMSSLELFVDWGAASDLGVGHTINSANLDLTLKEVSLSASEVSELFGRKVSSTPLRYDRLLSAYETEIQKTVDAAFSDYKFTYELPTGNVLTRTVIFATDNSARSDSIVSAFRIRDARTSSDKKEESWTMAQSRDKYEYGMAAPLEAASNFVLVGLAVCDYQEIAQLDMRGLKKGDVVMGLTTTSPTPISNLVFVSKEIA